MADPPIRAEVKGVRELQTGLSRLGGKIDDRARAEFLSVADQVASMVRGRVPHKTGRLASSVSGDRADHGASVGYDLIYAGPVDYGGWPRGRPYVPDGRFLYPTAREAAAILKRAGEHAAESEIGGMLWPRAI